MSSPHLSETRRREIRELIYREARLIDSGELDAWYELFTEDALYWMPLKRGQTEHEVYNALFYEDKLMLKVRIERLKDPNAFSQSPPSHCQHVLQRPAIESVGSRSDASEGSDVYTTRTPFIYVESQLDEQFVLTGVAHHELIVADGALRIRRKRIELLNREAALPSIQRFP